MRILALTLCIVGGLTPALAQSEVTVEIASRGQKVRTLLIQPEKPAASVILLAGGHGKLDLSADGKIGWGAGNQLVRTRAAYARAGFITAVPDIAPDLKTPTGTVNYYRVNASHARDTGAMVKYLRAIKAPVIVVGTSRGAISAGNAVAKLSGEERPDAMVLTAAMLMPVDAKTPSVHMAAGGDANRLQIPLLVVGHRKDRCKWTLPASIDAFKAWLARGGGKLDVVMLDGPEGKGDPCEAQSAHGFAGIDDQVVATVSQWIKSRDFSSR
ncbi:MAG: alpha/beta hydrolase [Rhizobiales bacterium]|nr:alpha/beta hydrolase [Hyphomicrobiales bacterium]